MTEKYANTMIINEPHTAHAAPIARVWGMIRAALQDGWHDFCPPPPPPHQVVDFKRVTTNHILLFNRVSSEHTHFWHISAAEQTPRRGDSARRGVSPHPLSVLPAMRLKCDVNDKTIFCTSKYILKEAL
ncbi:hypothetical protein R80B4_01874 [Fibrobacteres bacterium R8-0-B4]